MPSAIRPAILAAWLCSWSVALGSPAALSASAPTVRVSPALVRVDRLRHGQADRLTVWLRRGSLFAARQQGDTLLLTLPASFRLAGADAAGSGVAGVVSQWIRGLSSTPGAARLRLAPGAQPRVWQWSDRIQIDVDGTAPALQPGQYRPVLVTAPTAPVVPSPTAAPPVPVAGPSRPRSQAAPPPFVPPAAAAAPQAAAAAFPGAVSAILLPEDAASGVSGVFLPADRLTGAAAFSRGGELHVVLDTPRLLDLSQLKDDAVFGGTTERLLQDGMELRLRPAPGVQPRLVHREGGWVLRLGPGADPAPPAWLHAETRDGGLLLGASLPGRVVVLEDEATGSRLLVGTQLGQGQRVAAGHRSAEWALLPSWQGVAVRPLSDRVVLRRRDVGFELRTADGPKLAMLWPAGGDGLGENGLAGDGHVMTRRFDLPGLRPQILWRRLVEALQDAAMTPRTARAAPRLRVAEAMLACGLDAEADAVLRVAAADDPAIRADPAWAGLAAMAAWLSAHAGGAAVPPPGFDPASLGDSDEAMLWRALWTSPGGDRAAAAAMAASSWRLLHVYPELLRRKMLPALADLLAQGGQDAALDRLLAEFPDASLDAARAGRLRRQGRIVESLTILDRLASGTDRLVRADALEQAVELRLASHALTPGAAADQLDRQLYAWRGGDRELRLRLLAADLRAQGGAWRQALALLRETDTLFPEAHGRIHDAEIALVSGLLQGNAAAKLGALDLMALADDAAGLLGAADADAALAPLLADRLLALDLPERAEPVIRRLLERAGAGPARAGLGLRLAGLMTERGDAAGGLAVLDSSAGAADAAVLDSRALLRARLLQSLGRPTEALAAVSGLHGWPAADLQAGLLEGNHDWLGASRVLSLQMHDAVFGAMPETARADLVLRAARDASQVGNLALLRELRAEHGQLFAGRPDAGLFSLLTADPVRRVDDLPRSGREIAAMRGLGQDLAVARPQR